MNNIKEAAMKTKNAFVNSIFVLLGIGLLTAVFLSSIPKEFYGLTTNNSILDSLIGSISGSIAAGNPITSYVIGGELLANGATFFFVISFILAWTTVGLIQIPAESYLLGKKFAYSRNIISFFMAIIIAILTTITVAIL